MKTQKMKKGLAFVLMLAMMLSILPVAEQASAASKPAKPKISVELSRDGGSATITIGKTKRASGFQIVAKLPGTEKFTEVTTLELDGKKKRSYTLEDVSHGECSIKVRAYAMKNGKKVWGKYSKVCTIEFKDIIKSINDKSEIKVGDIIRFGSYEQDAKEENGKEPIEWIVLSNDDSQMFLLSRYVLAPGDIDDGKSDEMDAEGNAKEFEGTWEKCDLRKWLNEEFLNEAFNEKEAQVIADTKLEDVQTVDRIFLLSYDEAKRTDGVIYRDSERRCVPSLYSMLRTDKNGDGNVDKKESVWVFDISDSELQADAASMTEYDGEEFEGLYCFWWLRTSYQDGYFGMINDAGETIKDKYWGEKILYYEEHDDEENYVEKFYVDRGFGIRPAMKVTLTDESLKLMASTGKNVSASYLTADQYEDTLTNISEAKVGDVVIFGSYEQDNDLENGKEPIRWQVLSQSGSEMTLLSKYILDIQPYNNEKKSTTWEECSLRAWLNGEFYDTAFSESEKEQIKTKKVTTKTNPKYYTESGNATKDKVYLLSANNVLDSELGFSEYYQTLDIKRRAGITAYALDKKFFICEHSDETEEGINTGYWWLRSIGKTTDQATFVQTRGYVRVGGISVNNLQIGVRPVIVIKRK